MTGTEASDPIRLVFIAGWGRSGSTLIANLLGSSPDAVNLGELRYLFSRGLQGSKCGCGRPVESCEAWCEAFDEAGFNPNESDVLHIDRCVGATAIFAQFRALLTGRTKRYRSRNHEEVELLYQIVSARGKGRLVVDASKSIPFLINMMHDARFEIDILHLTRDPRAVAYSWSRLTASLESESVEFPQFGPLRSSLYWTIFNIAPLLFRQVRYRQLRYEDFVGAPSHTMRSISRDYGLEFNRDVWLGDATVDLPVQHTISGNPSRFRKGPITISRDQRWQEDMPRSKRLAVGAMTLPARAVVALFGRLVS